MFMSEQYYKTWIRQFTWLAVLNLVVCMFNANQLYFRLVEADYTGAVHSTILVLLNGGVALHLFFRVKSLKREQKEKVFEILSKEESEIW